MTKTLKFVGALGEKIGIVGLVALMIVALMCVATGCAVGTGPGGEVILGVEAGRLVRTAEQGMIAGASMIPGIGPLLSTVLGGAVAGGFTVKGASTAAVKMIEAKRKKADIAREQAEKKVVELEARIADKEGT